MDESVKLNSYIDKLVKAAVSQEEAAKNNYKNFNKYVKTIDRLFEEIDEDNGLMGKILNILMDHDEVYVRKLAAAKAIKMKYMSEKALKVMKEISEKKEYGIARIEAAMFLKYYNIADISSIGSQEDTESSDKSSIYNSEGYTEIIVSHIEKYIGKSDSVLHEIVSDEYPIDIYHIRPTKKRNYHTFITNGMSRRAMMVPEGAENFRYAELVITLPPEWPINEENFKKENNYWPIRCLKSSARLPFEKNTWLGYGHTIQNETSEKSYASNNNFCCMLLAYPVSVEDARNFARLKVDEDRSIIFYSLIPIYREEVIYKMKKGADDLLDKFDRFGISDIIDLNRKNVCK